MLETPSTIRLPRAPQAVVFDMDGLLFDTEALARDAMILTAPDFGYEMPASLYSTRSASRATRRGPC